MYHRYYKASLTLHKIALLLLTFSFFPPGLPQIKLHFNQQFN